MGDLKSWYSGNVCFIESNKQVMVRNDGDCPEHVSYKGLFTVTLDPGEAFSQVRHGWSPAAAGSAKAFQYFQGENANVPAAPRIEVEKVVRRRYINLRDQRWTT